MLGGSSSINAMYYVRGQDHDYQSWYAEGNPSWSPENVNTYFRKAENLQDMKLNEIPEIYDKYGHDGPFVINTFNHTFNEIGHNILDSWDHIGIKKVPDINAVKFKGQGLCAISRAAAANGQRSSTYSTYLKSASNRPNLRVFTNAFVTKILMDDNRRAYGVEVEINGKLRTILADREVIISAGSINTPQLLMLSGIGPEEELISHNIPIKVNLPAVGQNLQDHAYVPIPIYADVPGPENEGEKTFEILKYVYDKTGYLAHEFIMNLAAFFSRTEDMSYPEFQCHTIILRQNSSLARSYLSAFKDEVADSFMQYQSTKALFLIAFHLLHPYSKGNICLKSSNPHDHPIINAKYYSDERDVQASGDAIQIITKLLDTPKFKSMNAFIPKINLSPCNEWEYLSNDYWKCYAKHVSQTVFHPIGTAKMGPKPQDSVVDNFLKVHGVEGLRVIDASVMPSETSGNTMAPVIMIGEMGSDMIKKEYGVSK
ncbi:ecdysone oxidase-like [Maniola hyperantus]|uniref:ecdysone oxidase-like n=1 Tax=Aphantopus hyperantus TaxID=2795564 RepID=UPI00374808A7